MILAFAPLSPFLLIIIPLYMFPLPKRVLRKTTSIITVLLYFQQMAWYYVGVFIIANAIMIPFAFLKTLANKIKIAVAWRGSAITQVIVWLFFGLFLHCLLYTSPSPRDRG